ncbi:MAG: SRPBCC family protein [Pseudonocardia sp.]|nr:SRPBCC family protein [Pseudonocardia sp.]MDN5930817.1 SRPBCC family protein [Pseudonocardia sp.]
MWKHEHVEITTATAPQLWSHYADPANWPEWDHEVSAVTIDGPMVTGAKGTLKPAKGPTMRITFTEVTPEVGFTDVSRLPLGLATLTFDHRITPTPTGCQFVHRVGITGPLSPLLTRAIGTGIATEMPRAMRSLAALAEAGASAVR